MRILAPTKYSDENWNTVVVSVYKCIVIGNYYHRIARLPLNQSAITRLNLSRKLTILPQSYFEHLRDST